MSPSKSVASNFHRSARTLPAALRHAGRINRRYDTTGHSLDSGFAVSLTIAAATNRSRSFKSRNIVGADC